MHADQRKYHLLILSLVCSGWFAIAVVAMQTWAVTSKAQALEVRANVRDNQRDRQWDELHAALSRLASSIDTKLERVENKLDTISQAQHKTP